MKNILLASLTLAVMSATYHVATVRAEGDGEKPTSKFEKACEEEAAAKSLGKGGHTRYVQECVTKHESSEKTVTVTGGGKLDEDQKKRFIYCADVAISRKLRGESYTRFMRECPGRK